MMSNKIGSGEGTTGQEATSERLSTSRSGQPVADASPPAPATVRFRVHGRNRRELEVLASAYLTDLDDEAGWDVALDIGRDQAFNGGGTVVAAVWHADVVATDAAPSRG